MNHGEKNCLDTPKKDKQEAIENLQYRAWLRRELAKKLRKEPMKNGPFISWELEKEPARNDVEAPVVATQVPRIKNRVGEKPRSNLPLLGERNMANEKTVSEALGQALRAYQEEGKVSSGSNRTEDSLPIIGKENLEVTMKQNGAKEVMQWEKVTQQEVDPRFDYHSGANLT